MIQVAGTGLGWRERLRRQGLGTDHVYTQRLQFEVVTLWARIGSCQGMTDPSSLSNDHSMALCIIVNLNILIYMKTLKIVSRKIITFLSTVVATRLVKRSESLTLFPTETLPSLGCFVKTLVC